MRNFKHSDHAKDRVRTKAVAGASLLLIILFISPVVVSEEGKCDISNKDCQTSNNNDHEKLKYTEKLNSKRYILYNVNPGEGFNLRRDVYMRIAGLVRKLIRESPVIQWVLVLPPWGPLYHWQCKTCGPQTQLNWSMFFDLDSLGYYVPVIEFTEFLKHHSKIDNVYYLQHDDEKEFESVWSDKLAIEPCRVQPKYVLKEKVYVGNFWGFNQVQALNFNCVTVQGSASLLKPLIVENSGSVLIDRAEIVLHDTFGDSNYWAARRSMRFNKKLCQIGDEFRRDFLNSNDEEDKTQHADDWREMKTTHGAALGGPYIAIHLRRKDFVQSRKNDVPSLNFAAEQIKFKQKELKIDKVFVATDASMDEFQELRELIPSAIKFTPSAEVHSDLKDGGVAIVDQWICAHARFFIGTFESTFSFRIQEEREILGFARSTTFNRFCGDDQKKCQQPTRWKIVY